MTQWLASSRALSPRSMVSPRWCFQRAEMTSTPHLRMTDSVAAFEHRNLNPGSTRRETMRCTYCPISSGITRKPLTPSMTRSPSSPALATTGKAPTASPCNPGPTQPMPGLTISRREAHGHGHIRDQRNHVDDAPLALRPLDLNTSETRKNQRPPRHDDPCHAPRASPLRPAFRPCAAAPRRGRPSAPRT